MPQIRQLPPSVVNKIAAGEVIERPASVVKELLENSVDAGATRIDVAVEKGGVDLIRIADNGCGIPADQLELAVASHATSKIAGADDLFRVETLGFRGEALASIAEISQLLIRSRPAEAASGAELEIRGGVPGDLAPCGAPLGTTIEVRNLFHNTPVRRKFLRKTPTELGHVTEAFTRLALANPHVHFRLLHHDRLVHDLPPAEAWRERISALFGADLAGGLLRIEHLQEDSSLHGYVADPTFHRSNNRLQYLFLNGRHIRDRALQHALSEAYRGLLLTGRFPICFIRLTVSPSLVDVNVHPTKLEVRFQDAGSIYGQLLSTIRNRFLTTDLTATVRPPAGPALEPTRTDPPQAVPAAASNRTLWAESPGGQVAAAPLGSLPPSGALHPAQPGTSGVATHPAAQAVPSTVQPSAPTDFEAPRGLQLHDRYLVTEDEAGIVIIDQHALHERVLYEQLRQRILQGPLECQRLLVPEPVRLTAEELATVVAERDTLLKLGLEAEPFGGDTVLVSAYPAMLGQASPAEILRHVVELLLAGGKLPDRRDVVDELLHMISCKAAVKAGDRLTPGEVAALLRQRHLCQDAHHCPHGRPTALVFTRQELDKRFQRI